MGVSQCFGDGVGAVAAGVVAQAINERGGPTAVFDTSAAVLGISLVLVAVLWTENIMTKTESTMTNIAAAVKAVFANGQILAVGLTQSLFEGSMYSFVLVWVPSLKTAAIGE